MTYPYTKTSRVIHIYLLHSLQPTSLVASILVERLFYAPRPGTKVVIINIYPPGSAHGRMTNLQALVGLGKNILFMQCSELSHQECIKYEGLIVIFSLLVFSVLMIFFFSFFLNRNDFFII